MIETFQVLFTYEQDSETGDIKCIDRQVVSSEKKATTKKATTSKKKKDDNPIPQITLEDNKYCLNSAAVELMGVQPEDKLDIKYEKNGKTMVPAITVDENKGNRLTKTFTVSYRGKNNTQLAEYGTVFTLEAHPNKDKVFLLKGDKPIEIVEDTKVVVDDLDIDIDLNDFTDDNAEEISVFDFDLN